MKLFVECVETEKSKIFFFVTPVTFLFFLPILLKNVKSYTNFDFPIKLSHKSSQGVFSPFFDIFIISQNIWGVPTLDSKTPPKK